MSKYLHSLEYVLVVVVFGSGAYWAHERDAAEAAESHRLKSLYEYRPVAACVDERYMIMGDRLDDATWVCELDPLSYPGGS
ncbi:MAG TPA: hypothetical protein VFR37_05365 [Longimicrobium sp.]|nr:hypothetical protein [Longimicrobium sp.]